VIAKVQVRVVDPLRAALPERDVGELLPVARHQMQALLDVLDELVVVGRAATEQHCSGDVHVRRAVLEVKE
jgi:hypothetical protein